MAGVQCQVFHYGTLGPCTAVYFGRWNCEVPPDAFGFLERHPFPSSLITASMQNSLTQPFVHWYFFLLFSFPQLASTASSWRPFHGGLTSWTTAASETSWQLSRPMPFEESEWQYCIERAHGPNLVKRVRARSNGLLNQNLLSDEIRSPASGPPEAGPFFWGLSDSFVQ